MNRRTKEERTMQIWEWIGTRQWRTKEPCDQRRADGMPACKPGTVGGMREVGALQWEATQELI